MLNEVENHSPPFLGRGRGWGEVNSLGTIFSLTFQSRIMKELSF
jgi:hypothetical protein